MVWKYYYVQLWQFSSSGKLEKSTDYKQLEEDVDIVWSNQLKSLHNV